MFTTNTHSAEEVKNWFLAWTYEDTSAFIDNLKIQKLLYYAQGYSLAKLGRPIFQDEISAFRNGPVVRSVWEKLPNGKNQLKLNTDFDFSTFTLEESELLANVWATYGGYSGPDLVTKTHVDSSPWSKTWAASKTSNNDIILKDDIGQYFMGALYSAFLRDKEEMNVA